MSDGTTTWTNTYNANGMRIRRTDGTKTYQYIYDGSNLTYMNVDGNHLRFAHTPDGAPLSIVYNNATYYYVTNLQGDVVAILNRDGDVQVEYTYDAWGKVLSVTGPKRNTLGKLNPIRYRGYFFDSETGLYYVGSRYYNPETGRFINADNQLSTGDLIGANLFAYCGNNPVNRIDPTGHAWWHWAAAAAVVAIAAVATVVTAGGAAAAMVAVASVASGAAAATTASTIATGVLIGTSTALAVSAYSAAVNSNSADEFANYGASALTATITGGLFGGVYGYSLGRAQNHSPNSSTASTEGLCFVAGTLVKSQVGNKPIEEIAVGDFVWAWNEETGEVNLRPVVETYVNQAKELVHVFINGEEIITTPSHPFYSPIKGWTAACKLYIGDILVLQNGQYVTVEKVQHEILEEPIAVYNFEVAEHHTYYVGKCAVLVHNTCGQTTGLPKNGTTVSADEGLDMAIDYLGTGYSEVSPSRFVSADGARQIRIGFDDISGNHAGGPHINFDQLIPQYKSVHVYFFE